MPPHEDHTPRWNIIDKLYNKIDKTLDKAFVDNKCSFIEVEIVILMVKEKLQQQKHEMYALYMSQREKDESTSDKDDKESKDAPKNLYG